MVNIKNVSGPGAVEFNTGLRQLWLPKASAKVDEQEGTLSQSAKSGKSNVLVFYICQRNFETGFPSYNFPWSIRIYFRPS